MAKKLDGKTAIAQAIKEGAVVVTILEGKAPDHHEPEAVEIAGTISAPRRFVEKRKGLIEKNESYATIDKKSGQIVLLIDEKNSVDYSKITGTIRKAHLFEKLGINASKTYTTDKLSKELRMLRSIFPDKNQHANLVEKLRNFVATVNQKIETTDDLRANKTLSFKQEVNSSIPPVFTISTPIIEGEAPQTFEVSVLMEVGSSNDVSCYLESIDAQELYDAEVEKIIASEVEYLEKETTVIYI